MKTRTLSVLRFWTVAATLELTFFLCEGPGQEPKTAADDGGQTAHAERGLANELEAYLQKYKDVLPPKVYADLRKILDAHRPNQPGSGVKAQILSPRAGAKVGTQIPVKVKVPKIPEGRHFWIVVERGDLVWPKEPEVTPTDGHWSGTAYEGGPPGMLNLVLISVDAEGHARIRQWFERAQTTGIYRGLTLSSIGAMRIDTVKDLERR